MPPKAAANPVTVLEQADQEKFLHEIRKTWLKEKTAIERANSRYNMSKIQESWLKTMRSAKTKELRRDVRRILIMIYVVLILLYYYLNPVIS
jgi:hypothetical protein